MTHAQEAFTSARQHCVLEHMFGRLRSPRWQISGPTPAFAHASLPRREPQPQSPGRSLQAGCPRLCIVDLQHILPGTACCPGGTLSCRRHSIMSLQWQQSGCQGGDSPKMPSIGCSLCSASDMLLEEVSHPVYCAAFDGRFVLSMSCHMTAK